MSDSAAAIPPAERLRGRVQELGEQQHHLERHLSAALAIDHAGLMVMNTLIGSGPQTPSDLARRLDLSPAVMTLVLNRLEAAGHSRRDRHPSDGRKLVVTASAGSTDRATALIQPLIEGIARISAELSPAEQSVVESFLDRLTALYAEVAGASDAR